MSSKFTVLLTASMALFAVLGIGSMITAFVLLGAPRGVYLAGDQLRASGYEHEEWLWLLYTSYAFLLLGVLNVFFLVTRLNREEKRLESAELRDSKSVL